MLRGTRKAITRGPFVQATVASFSGRLVMDGVQLGGGERPACLQPGAWKRADFCEPLEAVPQAALQAR